MPADDEKPTNQPPPLAPWGEKARSVLVVAVVANLLISILRLATDLDQAGFWNPLRIVVSVVFTIAAATWAAAALKRQRQINDDGHEPR